MRLLHLTPVTQSAAILRGGISAKPTRLEVGGKSGIRGVYAMPIVADFWTTYQWLRELRSEHGQRMVAVHFRIPDAELVHVGCYWQTHHTTTAAEAAAWVMANPKGAEVVVPRKIDKKEILRVVEPRQLVGWTKSPDPLPTAHCVCFGCLGSGDPKFMRRLRAAYAQGWEVVRRATDVETLLGGLRDLDEPLSRARGRIGFDGLLRLRRHAHPSVRSLVADLLGHGTEKQVGDVLVALLEQDGDEGVRKAAAESLVKVIGCRRATPTILRAPIACQRVLLEAASYAREDAVADAVLEQLRRHGNASLHAEIEVVAAERLRE